MARLLRSELEVSRLENAAQRRERASALAALIVAGRLGGRLGAAPGSSASNRIAR